MYFEIVGRWDHVSNDDNARSSFLMAITTITTISFYWRSMTGRVVKGWYSVMGSNILYTTKMKERKMEVMNVMNEI